MSLNKIDVEVTQENEALVGQHLNDARSVLDFLIGLSRKEKRRLPKLGVAYVDFVDRFRFHVEKFPKYLSPEITVAHFDRDVDAREALERIRTDVKSFLQDIEDTILLLKSEYYQTARVYYRATRSAAAEGDKDAERIAKDLSEYYKRHAPNSDEPAVTPETPVIAAPSAPSA
ncbi:MAG: hypothetical protein GY950_08135 [bacterium]|nr:hypothetical protein [bacterium]